VKNKKLHVTGLGQCSWDYISLVDGYPEPDSKCEVKDCHEEGGGPVATALVTLARLGIPCSFHGVRGDDEAGRKIAGSLEKEGIHVNNLLMRENSASQKAFIAVERPGGRRTIFWKKPSGKALSEGELGGDFLANSSFLLLDGLMKDASIYAAKEAQKRKVPVMLDAGSLRNGMMELARECDYVVASEGFAKDLGWNEKREAFRKIVKKSGFGLTTITRGERGSLTFRAEGIVETPAFDVKALDTTGAGDVFHGAYIYGLLQEWDLEEALKFASACAALKCRCLGGRAGIATIKEVRQFMETAPLR